MQANIWNAHSNAPYKFMSLLPLLVCLRFLIDPFPLSYYSSYVKFSPCINITTISLPIFHYLCTLISPPLSSMTTKVQNIDRLRLSMLINRVRIIFLNLVQSRTLAKDIQLSLIQGQASSHLISSGILTMLN